MPTHHSLPNDLAAGAHFADREYGWSIAAFPTALAAAKRLGYACLGGQFQFRAGDGSVCEMHWLGADSSDRRSGESWSSYVDRSCGEVEKEFQRLVNTTDFQKEGRRCADGSSGSSQLNRSLVFVAYFVTEEEFSNLRVEIHQY